MTNTTNALFGALLLVASTSAVAEQPATAPVPAVAVVTPVGAENAILRAGTTVQLRMSEALTTEGKRLRVGHRFQLEVAENVTVDGQVVIPAGSPAMGEVTEVRNKGMWGKSGRINARILWLRANGRQIRLTGQIDDKGTTGTAGVIGAAVVLPVVGFFVTGTSARIPLNAPVTAFIDEDVAVAFATAPAPMVVATQPAVQPASPN